MRAKARSGWNRSSARHGIEESRVFIIGVTLDGFSELWTRIAWKERQKQLHFNA